jgi:hypothetical protein
MRRLRYVVLTAALAACAALALIPGTASARTAAHPSPGEYLATSYSHSMLDQVFSAYAWNLGVAESVSYNKCLRAGAASSVYRNDCRGAAWVEYGYLAVYVIGGNAAGEPWAAGWGWSWNIYAAQANANDNCMYYANLNNAGNAPCHSVFFQGTFEADIYGGPHTTKGGNWSLQPAP